MRALHRPRPKSSQRIGPKSCCCRIFSDCNLRHDPGRRSICSPVDLYQNPEILSNPPFVTAVFESHCHPLIWMLCMKSHHFLSSTYRQSHHLLRALKSLSPHQGYQKPCDIGFPRFIIFGIMTASRHRKNRGYQT